MEQRVLQSVPKIVYRLINRLLTFCADKQFQGPEIIKSKQDIVGCFLNYRGFLVIDKKMNAIMYEINEGNFGFIESPLLEAKSLVELLIYWMTTLKVWVD
jgi:hypothetical protein